ncbi:hypothetical protein MRX96_010624 [Rhipicephalus microplus]
MAEQSGYSAGKNQDSKSDLNKSTSGADHAPDPKNIQDLTQYVQTLLQQMQDKFQVMNITDLMVQAGVEEADK